MKINFNNISEKVPELGAPLLITMNDVIQYVVFMLECKPDDVDLTVDINKCFFTPYWFESDIEIPISNVTGWVYMSQLELNK